MTTTTRTNTTHIWHPYTRMSDVEEGLPTIERGEGIYLYDETGQKYMDAIASWWACSLGHSHPQVMEAITQQTKILQHSILGNLSHRGALELASRLAHLMPSPDRQVLFSSDGASAVEAALKVALQYWNNVGETKRTKFASLKGAYHGDTLGTVSVGHLESFHRAFSDVLFPVVQAEQPNFDTESSFESFARIFDEHGHELAAVIVEPLCQGAAGMNMYAPEYLVRLEERCRASGVLLIVDEIATGMGRTGSMFAFEHANIDPDIVCVGKAISAGYLRISATIVRDAIYQTFGDGSQDHTFYHGHTFAGNPIACAAALATLEVYEKENIVEQATEKGAKLSTWMAPFHHALEAVKDVRTLGLIAAVELKTTDPQKLRQLQQALLKENMLTRPLGSVFYLMPPLITPENELHHMVDTLYQAIKSLR